MYARMGLFNLERFSLTRAGREDGSHDGRQYVKAKCVLGHDDTRETDKLP